MTDLLIRRWRHLLILALVIAVPAGVIWARYEWDCHKKQRAFEQRLQEMRSKSEELKLGATKEEVVEFFRRNVIHYSIDKPLDFTGVEGTGERAVGGVLVPTCGSFVCDDEVLINITVMIDANGKIVSKDVRAWRTCL